jgi:hypothetical protein
MRLKRDWPLIRLGLEVLFEPKTDWPDAMKEANQSRPAKMRSTALETNRRNPDG